MGRVTAVFPDKKGEVRTVAVHTQNVTVVRPITKICVIQNKDTNSQSLTSSRLFFWFAPLPLMFENVSERHILRGNVLRCQIRFILSHYDFVI